MTNNSDFIPIHEWLTQPTVSAPFLVPNLISAGGLTLISGPPKRANKTYISLIMAVGLAANRKVLGQPKQQHKPLNILFLEEEGSAPDLKNRILRVYEGYDLAATTREKLPIFWSFRKRKKLNNPAHRQEIQKFIIENKIALTFVDTFSSSFNGDENDVKEVSQAMDTIYTITGTNNCSCVLLLHQKKGANAKGDIDDNLRGSSHLAASYDNHIGVIERVDAEGGYDIKVICRSRVQEEKTGSIALRFGVSDNGYDFVTGRAYFDDDGNSLVKERAEKLNDDLDMEKIEKAVRKKK